MSDEQPRRWSVWLTHNQIRIYTAYILFLLAAVAWPLGPMQGWIGIALSSLCGLSWFGAARHEAVLCGRCISEMPLDGTADAQHHIRALRFTHDLRYTVGSSIFGLTLTIAALWMFWLAIPGWIALTSNVYALKVHNRLYPWCPYCRPRDDDEEEPIVLPVPTGEANL